MMKPIRENKTLKMVLWILLGMIVVIGGIAMKNNTYDFKEERVTIPTEHGKLNALFITPKRHEGLLGAIIVVHGDGPQTASAGDAYKATWERLVNQGYAVISWDKPGVGKSDGHWLHQTMADRAGEVVQVIDWVKKDHRIDANNIGLWGASQAGWVVPKVVGKIDIAFTILVSPAINWVTQGAYHTHHKMLVQGKTEEEIQEKLAAFHEGLTYLEEGIGYEQYVMMTDGKDNMSEKRWQFVKANYLSDATEELKNFNTPVLLVLGGKDINVDAKETRMVYEAEIPEKWLQVAWFPESDHAILKPSLVHHKWKMALHFIFSPKKIVADGYYEVQETFVRQQKMSK